jgi:hypothetical protein
MIENLIVIVQPLRRENQRAIDCCAPCEATTECSQFPEIVLRRGCLLTACNSDRRPAHIVSVLARRRQRWDTMRPCPSCDFDARLFVLQCPDNVELGEQAAGEKGQQHTNNQRSDFPTSKRVMRVNLIVGLNEAHQQFVRYQAVSTPLPNWKVY